MGENCSASSRLIVQKGAIVPAAAPRKSTATTRLDGPDGDETWAIIDR